MNQNEITQKIVNLLRQTTNLSIIRSFLKSRSVPHSVASWDLLLEQRIMPSIESGKISNEDLIELLRSVEEHGKQHVFLYTCKKSINASDLLDKVRISSLLKEKKLSNLLVAPLILEQPEIPTLVDVRWIGQSVIQSLTMKMIEAKTVKQHIGSKTDDKGYILEIYEFQLHRAVSVIKLHKDGLLELRIASSINSSQYEDEIIRVWKIFEDFLPLEHFKEVSLFPAKKSMWERRDELKDQIRHTSATIRDRVGNVLRATNGSGKADLRSDIAVSGGLDYTLEKDGEAYCSASNVWLRRDGETEIHIAFDGLANEYRLPAHCTQDEYEYVLERIRYFNK